MPPEIRQGVGPTLLVFQPLGRRRGNWPMPTARICLKMKTIFRKKSLTAAGCKTHSGRPGRGTGACWEGQREAEERTAELLVLSQHSGGGYWWVRGAVHEGREKSKYGGVFGALAPAPLCVCRSANITFES